VVTVEEALIVARISFHILCEQ